MTAFYPRLLAFALAGISSAALSAILPEALWIAPGAWFGIALLAAIHVSQLARLTAADWLVVVPCSTAAYFVAFALSATSATIAAVIGVAGAVGAALLAWPLWARLSVFREDLTFAVVPLVGGVAGAAFFPVTMLVSRFSPEPFLALFASFATWQCSVAVTIAWVGIQSDA